MVPTERADGTVDMDRFVSGIKTQLAGVADTDREFAWNDCNRAFANGLLTAEQKAKELYIFLASWGMVVRGSFVLEHTWRILQPVVSKLDGCKNLRNPEIETVRNSIDSILGLYGNIDGLLKPHHAKKPVSATLITKIMLGALGCSVAYDTYVRKALSMTKIAPAGFSKKSFTMLCDFYVLHKDVFEPLRAELTGGKPEECPPFKLLDSGLWAYGLSAEQN